jgi:hypothetical protein
LDIIDLDLKHPNKPQLIHTRNRLIVGYNKINPPVNVWAGPMGVEPVSGGESDPFTSRRLFFRRSILSGGNWRL